jgi:hypothetical protein
MAVNKKYAEEIHAQFGYLATWLPTAPISVGDVGVVKDSIFTKVGTLKDFGISFNKEEHPEEADLEYTSAGAVEINASATGNAPIPGAVPVKIDGDVAVSFRRADAILFQASQCQTTTLGDLSKATERIIALFKAGKWPRNQVVVTDAVRSAASTVLISSGQDAHITLRVKGEFGAGKLQLANANASFDVKNSESIGMSIVSKRNLTPLFKARGIKTSWLPFNDPTLVNRSDGDLTLGQLDVNDLLELSPDGDRAG